MSGGRSGSVAADGPLAEVAARYAVAITPLMQARIEAGSLGVGAQFLPDARELAREDDEAADPIGDDAHSPVRGIVHRYPDRCLLKLVDVCAVYCRFCFRREMVGPGGDGALPAAALDRAIGYIAATPAIWEVIVTGGDPLVLSPRRVAEAAGRLAGIAHVKVVRWHTRVPLVDPARVDEALIAALRPGVATAWLALHANHPDEFTRDGRAAIARLVDAGVPIVSQTVLLRGVNDDPATLEALMRAFVENRVKPYYLHHLDPAPGTAHWRVGLAEGRALARAVRERASGLCQPAYVLDIPGGAGKALASAEEVRAAGDAGWRALGRDGIWRDCATPPAPPE